MSVVKQNEIDEIGNSIRIRLGDWLYNAGAVGFVNILKHAGDEVHYEGQEIVVKKEVLTNFEEKYFNYFIDTYEGKLAWYKVIEIRDFIENHEGEAFENFTEKELEFLNTYITDAKRYVTSNSHVSAYGLISEKYDAVAEVKKIPALKLKKGEAIREVADRIKETFAVIKAIIDYYSKDDAKKYIAGKNVIYTIIKNAWNGVSFLNPQTKEKDIYIDYKNYFIMPAEKYLEENKENYKYNCFACGSKIKGFDNELNFLNCTGFDSARKPSHVWNFTNDIAICSVCKLIYSCIPAGFTYVYSQGIYINANHSAEGAIRINNKIKTEVLKDDELNSNTTFKALINAMQETINETAKYELSDIQVIRYDNEKYKFNILSKSLLGVLKRSKNDLNSIISAGYSEVKIYFRFYEEVMNLLLHNANLFLLIHKVLVIKMSKPNDARFSLKHIKNLLLINFEYLKGVGCMEKIEKDYLKSYSGAGCHLKQAYKDKSSENKLNGIAYRLLNALKTNNTGMFMDTILNSYLYTGKQVPSFFTDCLKGTEIFKTIGYAFVTGLIEGEGKNQDGGNE